MGFFSRLNAMRARWQSELDDIRRTWPAPRRLDVPGPELCIVSHDVCPEWVALDFTYQNIGSPCRLESKTTH